MITSSCVSPAKSKSKFTLLPKNKIKNRNSKNLSSHLHLSLTPASINNQTCLAMHSRERFRHGISQVDLIHNYLRNLKKFKRQNKKNNLQWSTTPTLSRQLTYGNHFRISWRVDLRISICRHLTSMCPRIRGTIYKMSKLGNDSQSNT